MILPTLGERFPRRVVCLMLVTTGPRFCKVYLCTERHARTASQKSSPSTRSAGRQMFNYGLLSKHCRPPAMLYRSLKDTSTGAAGSRQRRVSTSGSSSVSGPISGFSGRLTPCVPHVGPVVTERLHLGNGFMPLLDLGPPMYPRSKNNPTR